ncbi:MAG: hypothetical protein ACRDPY_32750 [Streptosporangiaceae bacterium]
MPVPLRRVTDECDGREPALLARGKRAGAGAAPGGDRHSGSGQNPGEQEHPL